MGVQSRKNRRTHRRAIPLGLGGVTSRKNRRAHRRALVAMSGGSGPPRWYQEMQGMPDWYRQMQGTTLGDDTLDAMKTTPWQDEMLSSQKAILSAAKTWAEGDRLRKWVAIGATLAIPLSAAIWRALGIGRRRRP